jgi:hypothetical protein
MLVYVRPSNEHILIVRVPGAQDQRGCPPVRVLFLPLHRGVAKVAFDCAHRTRAFLGRSVVFLFQFIEPPGKPLVRADHFSKLNERSHNGNVDLDGALAMEHA